MTAGKGIVVPAGAGPQLDAKTAGESTVLKLVGGETDGSIMMFEQTVPAGAKSWFHLHRDGDEVVWVLEGEITFLIGEAVSVAPAGACAFVPRGVPHAWKNSGSGTGRFLALYTPAGTGGFIEDMVLQPSALADEAGLNRSLERYRWEIVGTNPL